MKKCSPSRKWGSKWAAGVPLPVHYRRRWHHRITASADGGQGARQRLAGLVGVVLKQAQIGAEHRNEQRQELRLVEQGLGNAAVALVQGGDERPICQVSDRRAAGPSGAPRRRSQDAPAL